MVADHARGGVAERLGRRLAGDLRVGLGPAGDGGGVRHVDAGLARRLGDFAVESAPFVLRRLGGRLAA